MVFLVHSINNETVNYLMAHSNLVVFSFLLFFFYFICYLHSVRRNWHWILGLVYNIALLSEGSTILLFWKNLFNSEVCFNLGTLLLQIFGPRRGYFLKRVIEVEPQFASACYTLGIYYLNIGRKTKAENLINKASNLGDDASLDIKQLLVNRPKISNGRE